MYTVPMILLVIGLFFVPELPRLLRHKGLYSQTRASLNKLRGVSVECQYAELEWAAMVRGANVKAICI